MSAQQYNRKDVKNASDKNVSQSGSDMNKAPVGQSSGGPSGRKNKGVEQLKVTMPKGGGAVSGMGEKFDMNPVTGTGSFSVPLPVSKGRENMTPQLSASYDSGSGNGILGIGWGVGIPSITIKTDKGLPKYDSDDVYLLSGIEDLVPFGDVVTVGDDDFQQFKPRIEGMFAKIERITSSSSVYWKVVSKEGLTSIYGESTSCRIADPQDQTHIFSWLLERTYDTKGNVIWYNYKAEDRVNVNTALPYEANRTQPVAQKYIKSVLYGNSTPYSGSGTLSIDDFMFRVLFDYGEHTATPPTPTEDVTWPVRSDVFSSYRCRFDLRTYRRCNRVCVFHKIDTAGWIPVKEVSFSYEDVSSVSRHLSRLTSMQMKGYRGTDSKTFPAIEFTYTDAAITESGYYPVVETPTGIENLPVGIDNNTYQWADLDGDGIGGILTQQAGAWHFKANTPVFDSENDVTTGFASITTLSSIPSLRNENAPAFSDIDGDGRAELIVRQSSAKGFFKRNGDSWDEFTEFEKNPVIDWNDPTLKMIDLTGDGHPDILLVNGKLMRWHPSESVNGFDKEQQVEVTAGTLLNDLHGPYIVFNDLSAPVFMADMTGDGLNDIVQITHNSVSYWPNLGYGNFGDKIEMDMGTTSFTTDQARFNGKYITLGDLDGSGTTDIVYSGSGSVEYWFNEAGNILTKGTVAIPLPDIDSHTNLSLIDLKANGTLCLAWSSISPGQSADQLKFVDLIQRKPHLLSSINNNMGKTIDLSYAPSTKFYLEDKSSNPPDFPNKWITTLPFPVHVVEKVTTVDEVAQTTHTMQYRYRHGYYDGVEREFRGFGMVESIDTTDFENWDGDLDSYVEPTLTKTWFHTGNPLHDTTVAGQYQTEYFEGIDSTGDVLLDSNFADEYLGDELREAYRAMKGSMLRQEIYSLNKDNLSVQEKIYTVSEKSYEVKRIQTTGDNKHAIFFKYDRETLNYHYEEDPEASSFSPRISHEFTLELDDYGNVLQKASLVYPRSGSGLDTEQTALKCTLERNTFINSTSSFYRIGVPAAIESFEIGGLTSTTPPSYFSFETISDHINASGGALTNILRYDESLSGTCARRIGWDRYYYWNEAQDAPLSNGSVTSKVLLHHAETAVTTPEQISSVFGTGITTTDRDDAGYILSDGYWWDKGLVQSYLGSSGFYLPQSTTDQWSNTTTVSRDTYFLAIDEITDPLGNTVAYDIDYVTLNPKKQTGMNGEVTELLFDPLGMVTVVSMYGSENSVDKGDMPLSGYSEPSSPSVAAILADPASFVQDATSYFFYDLTAKPTVALSVHREIHYHDLGTGETTPYQMAIEYADGFGRLFQAKKRVENGTAWIKSGSTWSEAASTNRWLTSGRTVYNNKQQPVKQYEPFYTDGHDLVEEEELVTFGVTPIIFYDPVGRVIRTDFPDGTYSKVEISPWQITTYDRNDTLTVSSPWYIAMSAGSSEEQDAATKALAHADTPTTQHLDTLARPYKTEEMPDASTTLTTTTAYDISGNILSVTDPRSNTVYTHTYAMQGQILKRIHQDSGTRKVFMNVMNNPVKQWDDRGHLVTTAYDALYRVTGRRVNDGTTDRLVESYIYGEGQTNPETHNLRGKLYRVKDGAGQVTFAEYDFKGNPLSKLQETLEDYETEVNWDNSQTFDSTAYTTTSKYDALNRPVETITPDSSKYVPTFNQGGDLDIVGVYLRGDTEITSFISEITYNNRRQRLNITYGSGVETAYTYDSNTFRLIRLLTERGTDILQDFEYTYDPQGNITWMKDNATQTLYYGNNIIDADRAYTYDALYRLIESEGREHINQPGNEYDDFPSGIALPHPNDPQAMRRYSRSYEYDNSGNISEMAHTATGANWTRDYTYNSSNNKLTQTQIGSTPVSYTYDNHGNLQSLPNVTAFTWDFQDQVKEADLGGGGTAYYVYNAEGQRVRKVIHNNSDIKIKETIYLDGYEIYHEFATGTVDFERETLHVMDDESRVAMVETKTIENGSPISTPVPRIRYQHSDHLGSCSVETSDTGALISFEEYYPYGGTSFQSTSSSSQVSSKRYRYNGKEKDEETNLYYYGARYYISWLGRWMSADPIGEEGSGLNLYRYASNNPVMRVDPDGMVDKKVEGDAKKDYKIEDLEKHYGKNVETGENRYNQEVTDILDTFKKLGGIVKIITDENFRAAYDIYSNALKVSDQFLKGAGFFTSAPEELSVFIHEGTHLKQWFNVFKERMQKDNPGEFKNMKDEDLIKSFKEMSSFDREELFEWKMEQSGSRENFIKTMLGFEEEAFEAERNAAKKLNEKSSSPLKSGDFDDLYPTGKKALKRKMPGSNITAEKHYSEKYGGYYDKYVEKKARKK